MAIVVEQMDKSIQVLKQLIVSLPFRANIAWIPIKWLVIPKPTTDHVVVHSLICSRLFEAGIDVIGKANISDPKSAS